MFWKIYFWLIVILTAIGVLITRFSHPVYIVDFIMISPTLTGFFLYAYKKKWLDVRFWKAFFPICFFWDIYSVLIVSPSVEGSPSTLESSFSLIFVLPIWIALYLYAFKFRKD